MYQVDDKGFFGEFGGAYVPEILYKCVTELQEAYKPIIESEEFKKEYYALLKDYVGRPSPLYYAKRMSEKYGCQLYLKREDLNHTGAHKINNTIGQILMAKKMGKTRIIAETGARTLVMQTEDGQIEEAFTISAGLDYPGIGPMHADLATRGRSHVLAIKDDEAIYAGYELTRMEGIIPAIESAHAVAALKKMKFKKDDVVVLTVSGRGDKDVETYLSHKEMAGEYGNF